MGQVLTAILITAAALGPGAALASGPGESGPEDTSFLAGSVMDYPTFDRTVVHVDLQSCPARFDPQKVFCRMTLADDQAHVFVFSYDGDQPLLAIAHYDLDDGFLPF